MSVLVTGAMRKLLKKGKGEKRRGWWRRSEKLAHKGGLLVAQVYYTIWVRYVKKYFWFIKPLFQEGTL